MPKACPVPGEPDPQGMNFINKTQRERAGGTGTGPLPPGMRRVNNQLPGHLGCCTGKRVGEGKRSLLRKCCLRATDTSPNSLEVGLPPLLKTPSGPQNNPQSFRILLDRRVRAWLYWRLPTLYPLSTAAVCYQSLSTNCSLFSTYLLCLLNSLPP